MEKLRTRTMEKTNFEALKRTLMIKKKSLIVEGGYDSRVILVLLLTSVGYQAIEALTQTEN